MSVKQNLLVFIPNRKELCILSPDLKINTISTDRVSEFNFPGLINKIEQSVQVILVLVMLSGCCVMFWLSLPTL